MSEDLKIESSNIGTTGLYSCPTCTQKSYQSLVLGSVSPDCTEYSIAKGNQVLGTIHGSFSSFTCKCGNIVYFKKDDN